MCPFVIKIAIDVNEFVELVVTIPMLALIITILVVTIVNLDPIKNSVIIDYIFFLFKLLYFFL